MFEELPEPQKIILTPQQKKRRYRQFAIVINYFSLFYSLLHKFIMPLAVFLFSKDATQKNVHFDFWFLYHVFLAVLLRRKKWDDLFLNLYLIFGLGSISYQIYHSFSFYHWTMVSTWVTALATLSVTLYLFSISECQVFNRVQFYLRAIVVLFLGLIFQYGMTHLQENFLVAEKHKESAAVSAKVKNIKILNEQQECGYQWFALPIKNNHIILPQLKTQNQIEISECGFVGGLVLYEKNQKALTLQNMSADYLNVKITHLHQGIWKALLNKPLRAGDSLELHPREFGDDIVMIFSDAQPQKGMVVLVHSVEQIQKLIDSEIKTKSQKNILVFKKTGVSLEKTF